MEADSGLPHCHLPMVKLYVNLTTGGGVSGSAELVGTGR